MWHSAVTLRHVKPRPKSTHYQSNQLQQLISWIITYSTREREVFRNCVNRQFLTRLVKQTMLSESEYYLVRLIYFQDIAFGFSVFTPNSVNIYFILPLYCRAMGVVIAEEIKANNC